MGDFNYWCSGSMKSLVILTLFSLALCQSPLPGEPIPLSAAKARAYIITGERSDDGSARAAPQELYTIDQDSSNEGIAECEELDNDSCTKIEVDFEVLKAELDIILEADLKQSERSKSTLKRPTRPTRIRE